MKRLIPKVTPKYLLLIAGIVWLIAGGNILKIGFTEFILNWHGNLIYLLEALLVFIAFMGLIFYPLVKKHHLRISQIKEEKVPFYQFFDKKSYLIMIFMITGGLLIRNLHLLPGIAIGVIYSGIGFSLAGAGILFLKRFVSTAGTNNKKGVENLIMKKYINISFIYAISALFSGVFYREFTKAFAFTGKTTLAFTHLHFFALGTIMFLLVAIFSCITNLSEQKQFKHFMRFYNVGLPFVVTMFYVRGITQVLGTELSKGMSAAISGISGISHIIMTVGIVMLFLALRNSQATTRTTK